MFCLCFVFLPSCLFIGRNDSSISCSERAIGIRWCRLDGAVDSHRSDSCLARQTLGSSIAQPRDSSTSGIYIGISLLNVLGQKHSDRLSVSPQVSSLNVADITSDEAEQELIKNDPLIWKGGVKCKWATATHECLVVLNSFFIQLKNFFFRLFVFNFSLWVL